MNLNWINIFISSQILNYRGEKLLFGQFLLDKENSCLNVNITTLIDCSKDLTNCSECQLNHLKLLGEMNSPRINTDWQYYLKKLNLDFNDVQICFRKDNYENNFQSMQLLNVRYKGELFPDRTKISIIFYDPSRLMKCQLFNFNLQGNR